MMVKICGITNREDALAAAGGGATALGFNLWPKSPRYVTPQTAAELAACVPLAIWKVGVFVNEPPEAVLELARQLGLDVVQIHGDVPLPEGARVWRAVAAGKDFRPDQLEDPLAEAFLVDAPSGELYGGTGRAFDWTIVRGARRKIVLAGGLDASNVRRAIATARPWGVDACSRLESSPGKKDHRKMAEFLKAALSENV